MEMRINFDGANNLIIQSESVGRDASVKEYDWGLVTDISASGEVIYFKALNISAQWDAELSGIISEIEEAPPAGTYSLNALKLENLPFLDLLKGVKDYIVTVGTPLKS